MNAAALKELYTRQASAMTRRPAFGRASGHARVRLGAGLACVVEQDGSVLLSDQPASEGGLDTGPHPGQLMRASLGACLAMGYRMWGARLDVAIDGVDVDLVCTYDARGQMGLSDGVAIGWERITINVTITSDAPADAVRRVVETADRLSPMLANLSPRIERAHHLTITGTTADTTNQAPRPARGA